MRQLNKYDISTAYEAELHGAGSVKRRLINRETDPRTSNQQKLQVFPAVAANEQSQSFAESHSQKLSVSNESYFKPIKRPNRFTSFVVSAIVLVTFAWSMQSLYLSDKQSYKSITKEAPDEDITNVVPATSDDLSNVKQIAVSILADNDWNNTRIQSFLRSWNHLDEFSTQEVINSKWYKLFTSQLKQKINLQSGVQTDQNITNKNDLLLTLALVTGVLENQPQVAAGHAKYNKLLDEIAKEISIAEKKSKLASDSESEATLNAKLKKKYSYIPGPARITPAAPKSEIENAPKIQKAQISGADITATLNEYKRMYESGNINSLTHIFNVTTPNTTVFNQQKKSLETIFKISNNRSINFYETKWKLTNSEASVTTRINSSIEFNHNKGTQYVVAKAQLNLQKKNNTVVITEFNILDRHVSVVPNSNKVLPAKQKQAKKLLKSKNIPTAAELQDITTQLIATYESGNLQKFLSLFSSNIKTNDRNDIEGVKKDYQELFNTTSERQMFIQNMKWTNESIGAKGTGDMEVMVSGKEGSSVFTMSGKIEIVAQKSHGKVLITHLYHIERAK